MFPQFNWTMEIIGGNHDLVGQLDPSGDATNDDPPVQHPDHNQEDKDPLLSLDAFEIFMLTSNQYTGPVEGLGTIGDLIYTLDYSGTDNYILLDYMFAYIPNSLFLGYSDTDYVYLYSMFGATNGYANNAGFEEWAVRLIGETPPPPPVVPVPGAVILGMLGLTVAGVKLRKYA